MRENVGEGNINGQLDNATAQYIQCIHVYWLPGLVDDTFRRISISFGKTVHIN